MKWNITNKKQVDNEKAKAKRHFLVGPSEKWKNVRNIHIKFLKESGLKPQDYLLDVGCGTLRGGIPLINYLEKSHYYGIEVRSEALEEAWKELFEEKLSDKGPVLILSKDLSPMMLDRKFDYVWAYSVLIHMTDEKLNGCFEFVSRHLMDKGTFLATVNIGNAPEKKWLEFPEVWRSLEFYSEIASSHGLKVQDKGQFGEKHGYISNESIGGRRMLKISKK